MEDIRGGKTVKAEVHFLKCLFILILKVSYTSRATILWNLNIIMRPQNVAESIMSERLTFI